MSYVIYNTESTVLMDKRVHKTERAAKMALTRAVNAGDVVREDMTISTYAKFKKVEKTRTVKSLMTGEDVVESVNTPYYLSVASESYWSM